MHGTSRFQSSRRRGYGADAATSDANKQAAATTKGLSLSDEQFESIISGITDIGKTAITTVGGIETARITGKSPTTSSGTLPSPGRGTVSGGRGSGGSGISGTTLAVGGLVVVGLGVGAYFVFRRK